MSIPGLGQLPIKPAGQTLIRTVRLQAHGEWRFKVGHNSPAVQVRLEAGTAERDGTELALGRFYSFKGIMSKISTVEGCILTVEGECDSDHVAEGAQVTLDSTFQLNLDTLLRNLRRDAYHGNDSAREVADHVGPRIMIVGPSNVGKTTLARTLTARATKCRDEPQVVNLDPAEGLLSLPGTLTAATFATLMDVESMSGWGGTPTSGPSTVPVKLPIVYYYGRQHATDDPQLYKEVVSKLAGAVTERLNNHYLAKTAGLIIDTPAVDLEGKLGDLEMDLLAHVVDEFSVNMIVAMGVKELERLKKRFHGQETSVSDTTAVISVGKSQGGAEKDEAWLLACQQATIKEYFFGDSKMTLNPSTQLVDIESVTIYRIPEPADTPAEQRGFEKVDPSPALSHWTMPVMNAKIGDSPEAVRTATVKGFVYIADVNKDRRKVNILAPTSGRDPSQPLLLGTYPEPYINLLG